MMNEKIQAAFHSALIIPHSSFLLEPVAQTDQSAGLRSLRSHVRVVPGSFTVRGRLRGGRLSLKRAMRVRDLLPESVFVEFELEWRNRQTRGAEVAVGREGPLRVRVPPPASSGGSGATRQTRRPQKAAHVSSNLTSRTSFCGRAPQPKRAEVALSNRVPVRVQIPPRALAGACRPTRQRRRS